MEKDFEIKEKNLQAQHYINLQKQFQNQLCQIIGLGVTIAFGRFSAVASVLR